MCHWTMGSDKTSKAFLLVKQHQRRNVHSDNNNNNIINNTNNCLAALYLGPPTWAGITTLRNINPVYHPHCPQIPHKHSQPSLPGLTASLPLWSNTKQNMVLYTSLILDLTVNRWSPLIHISWPAAATQMTARPAMHPEVRLCRMPFLRQPSLFYTNVHSNTVWNIVGYSWLLNFQNDMKIVSCNWRLLNIWQTTNSKKLKIANWSC